MRIALLSLGCLAFAGYMVYLVFTGLRSGRLFHTDSRSYCERSRNPMSFWLLVVLFSLFALLAVYAWVMAVLPSVQWRA
jgi:hypothetical protein